MGDILRVRKAKVAPVHALKAYGGVGYRSTHSLILNLDTKCNWVDSLTPKLLAPPPPTRTHTLHISAVDPRLLGRLSRRQVTIPTMLPGLRRWEENIKIYVKVILCNSTVVPRPSGSLGEPTMTVVRPILEFPRGQRMNGSGSRKSEASWISRYPES